MNDITALMATMKAVAEKATPGEWRYLKTTPFMDAEISAENNTRVVNLLAGDVTQANSEFIALANPANVKALVEALEKAQQTEKTIKSRNRRLEGIISVAENRIAELETRTATVKWPTPKDASQGWKIDPEFICKVRGVIGYDEEDGIPSMEVVEAVLLAVAGIQVIEGEGQ